MGPDRDNEDPRVVVRTDSEDAEEPTPAKGRVGTKDLLDAIRDIPAQVAAQVKTGSPAPTSGRAEVTFEAEPEPLPDNADDGDADGGEGNDEGPTPTPPSAARRTFRHPSRGRKRVEIGT